MNNVNSVTLGLAAFALATTVLAASLQGQSAGQQPPAKPAEDPATGLFVRLCNDCHDSARVVSPRRTRTDWEDVINKMVEKGATGTDKELETVFEYLVRNYGKVYINTSKADEIAAVLGLSKKDAEAIVAYRTAKGAFADLAAVKGVPDIDLKAIEDHKDAIVF